MNLISITPRQAKEHIKTILGVGLVPFVSGSPGTGKSTIIKEIANEAGLVLIDYRASMGTPEDFMGLPFREGDTSVFLPFSEIFPVKGVTKIPKGRHGFMLLLDEVNSAPRSMIAALYKLVLDRMVGMQELHPDTYIVLAGNKASDKAIVNSMGTAMQSRLIHLEVEPDTKEWLEDVAIPNNYDSRVVAFINAYPSKLMNFDPDHKEATFACPRTWSFVNSLCNAYPKNSGIPTKALPVFAGAIGEGIAIEFVQFTQVFKDVPSLEQVVKDPSGTFIPDTPTLQWATVCSLAQTHTLDQFKEVSEYVGRFRHTFNMIYHKTVLARLPDLRNKKEWLDSAVNIHKYLYG